VPIADDSRLKLLYLRTQKAHYKTTSVKKLDIAIKIYGCIVQTLSTSSNTRMDGSNELRMKVIDKLISMLSHPFPRIREKVVDELWVRCGVGKGLDVTRKVLGKGQSGEIRAAIAI
jgi:hypothetical protein